MIIVRPTTVAVVMTMMVFCISLSFSQIKSVVDMVSADSMIHSLKELTGALPTSIAGRTRTINTRLVLSTGSRWGSQYIVEKFRSMGLSADHHPFPFTMRVPVLVNQCGLVAAGNVFYMSTDWGEVFQSNDMGKTWVSIRRSGIRNDHRVDWIFPDQGNRMSVLGSTGACAVAIPGSEVWDPQSCGFFRISHAASRHETIIAADSVGRFWRSADFGSTWEQRHADASFMPARVVCTGNGKVLVAGRDIESNSGRVLQSTDDGRTWSAAPDVPTLSGGCLSAYATDSLHIWIAGTKGQVIRSVDGGATWYKSTFADTTVSAKDIFFANESVGWVTGANNSIYRTTDGGAVWKTVVAFGAACPVEDLRFASDRDGIILGRANTFYTSHDSGTTWSKDSLVLMTAVVATLRGTKYPDRFILVTAHSDSEAGNAQGRVNDRFVNGPGADDDGTGVVGLFELARIFAQYRLPISMKFAAVPDEEWFNQGANTLSTYLFSGSDTLVSALDLDMIGYDAPYPQVLGVTCNSQSFDVAPFVGRLKTIVQSFGIPLTLDTASGGVSNQAGIGTRRIPLIALAEQPHQLYAKVNPYYHKATDTWETINQTYLCNVMKAASGYLYDIAMNVYGPPPPPPEPPVIPGKYRFDPVYPNPVNASVTISFAIPTPGPVTVTVYSVLGETLTTLVAGNLSAAEHRYQWNPVGLASGVYYCRFEAGGFVQVRSIVLVK